MPLPSDRSNLDSSESSWQRATRRAESPWASGERGMATSSRQLYFAALTPSSLLHMRSAASRSHLFRRTLSPPHRTNNIPASRHKVLWVLSRPRTRSSAGYDGSAASASARDTKADTTKNSEPLHVPTGRVLFIDIEAQSHSDASTRETLRLSIHSCNTIGCVLAQSTIGSGSSIPAVISLVSAPESTFSRRSPEDEGW